MPLGLPASASLVQAPQPQQPQLGWFDKLSGAMFPTAAGVDPQQAQAQQRQAMLMTGLGMMAGGAQGQRTGQALFGAYGNAQQGFQGAMQNAYQNTLVKREQERREARESREQEGFERETRGMDATEVSRYLSAAPEAGVSDWMARGIQDPEMRAKFDQFGLTPLIESALQTPEPEDDLAAYEQAQAVSGAAVPMLGNQAKPPASIAEYQLARNQGYGGSFEDWTKQRNQRFSVVEYGGEKYRVDNTGVAPPQKLSSLAEEADAERTQAAAQAGGKVEGTAAAEAVRDLPKVQGQTETLLGVLDQIEGHPGLSAAVGMKGPTNLLPGTHAADFKALVDQASGAVFLQAFQELKGGGHITEIEGQKAEEAVARVRNRSQSEEGYMKALSDLREVLIKGRERAERKAAAGITGESTPEGVDAAVWAVMTPEERALWQN